MLYYQSLKKSAREKITSIELAKWLNKRKETVYACERGIYQPGVLTFKNNCITLKSTCW
jgi:hypothetical protein